MKEEIKWENKHLSSEVKIESTDDTEDKQIQIEQVAIKKEYRKEPSESSDAYSNSSLMKVEKNYGSDIEDNSMFIDLDDVADTAAEHFMIRPNDDSQNNGEPSLEDESTDFRNDNRDEDPLKYTLADIDQALKKPFECGKCYKRFTQKTGLTQHMLLHTGLRPHQCNICQKTFAQRSNYKQHMKLHTGARPYECNVCQKRFTKSCNLSLHVQTHSKERPYKCNICNKSFNIQYTLSRHIQTHTGETPYECNVCGRKFSKNCNLNRHLQIHTGERPFECIVCQKRFHQNSHLLEHIQIHTGERTHECSICAKKFMRTTHLASHMRTHTDDRPYECPICNMKFAQSGNRNVHVKNHSRKKKRKRSVAPLENQVKEENILDRKCEIEEVYIRENIKGEPCIEVVNV